MPSRRNVRKYSEPKEGLEAKFFFFIFTFGSVWVLAFLIWAFGIDFGIMRIGGHATVATAFWAFVIAMLIEYVVDVRYALNIYQKFKLPLWPAFLPIVNCIGMWGKWFQIATVAIIGSIFVAILLIVTPIITYINPGNVITVANNSAIYIIVAAIVLCILRGSQQAKLKVDMINRYTQLVGLGAAPMMGVFKSLLYFVPVIRMVLMLEDLTFFNNVFDTIQKNARIERGDL